MTTISVAQGGTTSWPALADHSGAVFHHRVSSSGDDNTEIALMTAIAGRDRALALLRRFGGVSETIGAPAYAVADIAGPDVARSLEIIRHCAFRMADAKVHRRCVLSSWSAVLAYVKLKIQHETIEQFRVLFLDKKNQLIIDEVLNTGTVDHAPVYPREVLKRALLHDASAIILCHNHPSGDPTPSSADIDMTRQIIEAGRGLRITVHDHMIVGRESVASLKSLGLI
jgi:DNA repair protein RadC